MATFFRSQGLKKHHARKILGMQKKVRKYWENNSSDEEVSDDYETERHKLDYQEERLEQFCESPNTVRHHSNHTRSFSMRYSPPAIMSKIKTGFEKFGKNITFLQRHMFSGKLDQ